MDREGRLPSRRWAALGVVTIAVAAAASSAAMLWPCDERPIEIRDGVTLVVDREALARVPLAQVHEELFPDWISASGGVRQLHFERLRRAVGADANLRALLDRMGELAEADPVRHGPELQAIVGAWNQYLTKGGAPYRIGGEVVLGEDAGRFLVKTYRVVDAEADTAVRIGEDRVAIEVRRRLDDLGAQDTWLGKMHDHDDGVVILLDRVTSFAFDEVWPTFDPELPLSPLQQRFGPALRAELGARLTADEQRILFETAGDRFWMMRATAAIHARHDCGSAFTVSRLAWNGFSPRDVTTFHAHAEGPVRPCPEVLPEEALVFATRSWHLQHTPGVREALEHLVALVAEGVVVHEARHAADDHALDGQRIACVGCPPDTSHLGALEGSAYAAGFADDGHAVLALFQACSVAPHASEEVRDMIGFLADRVVAGGCEASPPADLPARAARVEHAVFLRSDPISLEGFPDGFPVSSEYRSR